GWAGGSGVAVERQAFLCLYIYAGAEELRGTVTWLHARSFQRGCPGEPARRAGRGVDRTNRRFLRPPQAPQCGRRGDPAQDQVSWAPAAVDSHAAALTIESRLPRPPAFGYIGDTNASPRQPEGGPMHDSVPPAAIPPAEDWTTFEAVRLLEWFSTWEQP